MGGRSLFFIGVSFVLAAFAIAGPGELNGYKSACACESPRDSFAYFLDIPLNELENPAKVADQFLKKFPPGTATSVVVAFKSDRDTSCESFADRKLLVCKYLYEDNDVHRRGYSIVYSLDDAGRIAGVRAMRAYAPLRKGR